jgi:hypothetical protein
MALSTDDRVAIYELIALHGHLVDAGELNRLGELFTDDFVYDVAALGFGSLEGADALTEASRALGDANPLAHHVTNALVVGDEGDRRRCGRRESASWPMAPAAASSTRTSFAARAPGGGSRGGR